MITGHTGALVSEDRVNIVEEYTAFELKFCLLVALQSSAAFPELKALLFSLELQLLAY